MAFPFHDLPFVPQQKIVKHLDPIDLLLFSFLSKRSCQLTRRFNIKIESLSFTLSYHSLVTLKLPNSSQISLKLRSVSENAWKVLDLRNKSRIVTDNVNGLLSYNVFAELSLILCRSSECSVEQVFQAVIDHLFKAFRVGESVLKVWRERENATSTFQIYQFLMNNPNCFEQVYFKCLRHTPFFSADEVSLLKHLPPRQKFILDLKQAPDFKFSSPMIHKTMEISNASWLTIGCLISMECVSFKALDVLLTSKDINFWIKNWLEGGYAQLERMMLVLDEEVSEEQVLEGCEKLSWDPDKRPGEHGEADCYMGIDIRRPDGLLATVVCEENRFKFYIWHRKFLRSRQLQQ